MAAKATDTNNRTEERFSEGPCREAREDYFKAARFVKRQPSSLA
jgi:hypothetical protein